MIFQKVPPEIQKSRVKDIFILSVDGLAGFFNAIETVLPKIQVNLLWAPLLIAFWVEK